MREDNLREIEALRARVAELEAARREWEQGLHWFQTVLDTIPYPIFSKDATLRYDACNAAFCELLGLPKEKIVGSEVFDVAPADKAAVYHHADAELLRARGNQTYETTVRHADGTDHAVIFHEGVYAGRDGEIGGIVGIIVDITERKRIEEALLNSERVLREREQRFRSMIENASDAIALFDGQGAVLYHSPAITRMLGWAPEELVGRPALELCHPDDLSSAVPTLQALFAQRGGRASAVARMRHKDGTWRHIETIGQNLLDSPAVGAIVVNLRDVTDREERHATELQLREMLETVHLLAVVVDPAGVITFCNDALLALTGWTREELVGRDWFDMLVPEQSRRASRARYLDLVRSDAVPKHLELPLVTKSGAQRLVAWDSTMLRAVDGGVRGAASLGRDVTEQRELEDQLRQAQKMESVGRLAGGVAHDFNNLLTGICGYTDLMLQELRPEDPLHATAKEILAAGERASRLVRQLLAFSRKQVLQPSVIDLSGLLRERENMLRRVIGEDVELHTALAALRQVKADPLQLEQVVLNLVINARDAMPTGGELTLETADVTLDEAYAKQHPAVHAGEYVLLAITDTGHGMDAETMAHIFEPFYTTKEKGKGTGLGLSTVYGIVRQSGGWIWVYSEVGRGTTFKVYLPIEVAAGPATRPEPATPIPRGTETVLVVEDEVIVRGMISAALSGRGYRVLVAADGASARRVCEEHGGEIHLLLADVVLPRGSGRDLARELVASRPGMRVIFMSGYTESSIIHHGVLEEGLEFLAKPFSPDGLARTIRAVLDDPSRGTKS
jgi:PAS domain S-box-containing protein